MASLLSRLAPLIITLRGSKRQFRSSARTLAAIEHARQHPREFAPKPQKGVTFSRRDVGGWPVYEVRPDHGATSRRAVYLHGGVYTFEIDPIHWRFVARLAVETGTTFVVPIMPLSPIGTASVVVRGVADLVESLDAPEVSILGDSSGGGMALAVAMELRDRGARPLHSIVLIAPWLDISGTDPRLAEIEPRDPWLAVAGTRAAGALYRAELSVDDPRVSPIHGSLDSLVPITLFSGTRDILNADAHRLVARAAEVGHPLVFHEGEGMIHNYPILPMPEGDAARALIAKALVE